MEDRLRDAYRAAAQTVRPESIKDLPDQPTQPVPPNPAYKFDPYTGKPVDQSTTV